MVENVQKIRATFINIIPSAVVTQALASAGADTIVIDQEHAPVGPENLHAMIASTAGTKCLPLVRVTKRDEAMVKLALDFGAAGIVFPLTNTAEEAAECVAMTRYPPHGRRGFGPFVGHSRWGTTFEKFERATTAAKIPRSTVALTQEQVKSAAARGYSSVMLGFDILMLKNAAATAISWLDS